VSGLSLRFHDCVRINNKNATCTRCESICPENAITLSNHQGPSFIPSSCSGCGGCLGACPTEAFSLQGFSYEHLVHHYQTEQHPLRCGEMLPCLSALHPEYLIALALEGDDLILDIDPCNQCQYHDTLYPKIKEYVNIANHFLEHIEAESHVCLESLSTAIQEESKPQKILSRRGLLQRLSLKEGLKAKKAFESRVEEDDAVTFEDFNPQKVREKQVPFRRQLFISATRHITETSHHLIRERVPFLSDKILDKERCTNCALCYNICPTGALHGQLIRGEINFDLLHCVSCHSCHDACAESALHLAPEISTNAISHPERKRLAKFWMRPCGDCGMLFIYKGDDLCERCNTLDNEAKELLGW